MFIIFYIMSFFSLFAEVKAPNYNFTLDQLALFYPGESVTAIKNKWGKGEKLKMLGENELWRFKVKYERYFFPVLVQIKNDKIQDMFAQLPTYFLHDVFHQSLINKWGKQQKYSKKEEAAFYEWDLEKLKISYNATCTITCFPIYLHMASKEDKDFKSQLDWLKEQSYLE